MVIGHQLNLCFGTAGLNSIILCSMWEKIINAAKFEVTWESKINKYNTKQ